MGKPLFRVTTVLIVSLLSSQALLVHATNSVTYEQPIAYIGWDGNIWITDLNSGAGTAITKDAYRSTYTNIQWSPTDNAFKVDVTKDLYVTSIFKSSLQPIDIRDTPQDNFGGSYGEGVRHGVWSLDGKGIVYLNIERDIAPDNGVKDCHSFYFHVVLEEHIINSSEKIIIGRSHNSQCYDIGIGEGPSFEAQHLLAREDNTERYMFSEPSFSLVATESGYIYDIQSENAVGPWSLNEEMFPNGDTTDLSNKVATKFPVALPHDAETVRMTGVSKFLVYGTVTPTEIELPEDGDLDRWEGQLTHRTVRLWRASSDGSNPILLWARTGYDVGRILPTPDGKGVVVSFVTLRAITRTRDYPAFAEGTAHVELLYTDLTSGATRLLAIGAQPALGKFPFTAVPAQ